MGAIGLPQGHQDVWGSRGPSGTLRAIKTSKTRMVLQRSSRAIGIIGMFEPVRGFEAIQCVSCHCLWLSGLILPLGPINVWDNYWINNGVMDIKHTSWWVYIMAITLSFHLLVILAIIPCSRGRHNTTSCSHVSLLGWVTSKSLCYNPLRTWSVRRLGLIIVCLCWHLLGCASDQIPYYFVQFSIFSYSQYDLYVGSDYYYK